MVDARWRTVGSGVKPVCNNGYFISVKLDSILNFILIPILILSSRSFLLQTRPAA